MAQSGPGHTTTDQGSLSIPAIPLSRSPGRRSRCQPRSSASSVPDRRFLPRDFPATGIDPAASTGAPPISRTPPAPVGIFLHSFMGRPGTLFHGSALGPLAAAPPLPRAFAMRWSSSVLFLVVTVSFPQGVAASMRPSLHDASCISAPRDTPPRQKSRSPQQPLLFGRGSVLNVPKKGAGHD
jgi:hypothetical protein